MQPVAALTVEKRPLYLWETQTGKLVRKFKQVGGELGISEITVEAHRGKVMRKMGAKSLADLVTMAARLRVTPAPKR